MARNSKGRMKGRHMHGEPTGGFIPNQGVSEKRGAKVSRLRSEQSDSKYGRHRGRGRR
jgi:hypothetical protein